MNSFIGENLKYDPFLIKCKEFNVFVKSPYPQNDRIFVCFHQSFPFSRSASNFSTFVPNNMADWFQVAKRWPSVKLRRLPEVSYPLQTISMPAYNNHLKMASKSDRRVKRYIPTTEGKKNPL